MKILYFVAAFAVALSTVSCKKEKIEEIKETIANNELTGLNSALTIEENGLKVEIFTPTGTFKLGYNDVYYRVKDSVTNKYLLTAELSVTPIMQMMNMSHGTPVNEITKMVERPNMYRGGIIFTMASNQMEYWTLEVNVTQGGTTRTVSSVIDVQQSVKRNLNAFEGTDGNRYILAMVKPLAPIVGQNDITAQLFKRIDGFTYEAVPNFAINIDPRMPSMGNHSSPNNVHMTSNNSGTLYSGKLNLTMTGYWRINLMAFNAENTLIKGEEITESNTESTLFFEIEF